MESKRVRIVFPSFQHKSGRRDVFVGWSNGVVEKQVDHSPHTQSIGVYDDLGDAYIVKLIVPVSVDPFVGFPTHFVDGIPSFLCPFEFKYIGKVDHLTGEQNIIKHGISNTFKEDRQLLIEGEDSDYLWTGPKEIVQLAKNFVWRAAPNGMAYTIEFEKMEYEDELIEIPLRDFVLFSAVRSRLKDQNKRIFQSECPLTDPIQSPTDKSGIKH